MTPTPARNSIGNRDHGGGLDAAIAQFGGSREGWIDLSTGINPVPYPLPTVPHHLWASLPDTKAQQGLIAAARRYWNVPQDAAVLAAPGASALIACIPSLMSPRAVCIVEPTYNEHAAAFRTHGWRVTQDPTTDCRVLVSPNNPTGTYAAESDLRSGLTVVDESFCDMEPGRSLIAHATRPNTIILKSFGKFWGLAGLRLGFAIGDPTLIDALAERIGPWAVSGPALHVGMEALSDESWSKDTIERLMQEAARLDRVVSRKGAEPLGGTSLFRLYRVDDARAWQDRLAAHQIWSRVFPYSTEWIRMGLPPPEDWDRLEAALS